MSTARIAGCDDLCRTVARVKQVLVSVETIIYGGWIDVLRSKSVVDAQSYTVAGFGQVRGHLAVALWRAEHESLQLSALDTRGQAI